MEFYGISSSEGALDKNLECNLAPKYLADLFNVQIKEFKFSSNDPALQQEEIFVQAKKIFQENPLFSVFFGGTHNITYSLFWAFLKFNKNAKLIVFDAHVDSDNGLSVVSHEDFIKQLIQNGFPAEKIMIVGVTKIFESEKEFVENSGIKIIKAEEILENVEESKKRINDFVSSGEIYFSFDVDVLKEMKATYYKDGNLSKEILKDLIKKPLENAKVIDIVEFNPSLCDGDEKLLKELFQFK